jgi:hypothetical protein
MASFQLRMATLYPAELRALRNLIKPSGGCLQRGFHTGLAAQKIW